MTTLFYSLSREIATKNGKWTAGNGNSFMGSQYKRRGGNTKNVAKKGKRKKGAKKGSHFGFGSNVSSIYLTEPSRRRKEGAASEKDCIYLSRHTNK